MRFQAQESMAHPSIQSFKDGSQGKEIGASSSYEVSSQVVTPTHVRRVIVLSPFTYRLHNLRMRLIKITFIRTAIVNNL